MNWSVNRAGGRHALILFHQMRRCHQCSAAALGFLDDDRDTQWRRAPSRLRRRHRGGANARRFEQRDVGRTGRFAQQADSRPPHIEEAVSHAGAARQHGQRAACAAHAQRQRMLELVTGEFTYAEGYATQFLNKRQLGCMPDLGLFQEDALHLDPGIDSKQRHDQLQKPAFRAAGPEDHGDTPRGLFSLTRRHRPAPLRPASRRCPAPRRCCLFRSRGPRTSAAARPAPPGARRSSG